VQNQGHSGGACGNAVDNIMALNPDALIVGGIGASPAQGFANARLDLYFDQNSATVEESVTMLISGKLKKSSANGTCSVH
ncbi:MAG: dinitrogenase iron-molybdenum cofactor biosynthesis protein, partial [Sulfurovum sp.]|nr:dinitrogenase iron-molybdenum cofactor biosynthesis protein [Sulfurovum sp.]